MATSGYKFKSSCPVELIMTSKTDSMQASENIKLLSNISKQMIEGERKAKRSIIGDSIMN